MEAEEKGKGKWFPRLFSLQGETAMVTGAGSGLGQAIARGMAEAGAQVAVVDLSRERASSTARRIEEDGGKVMALETDVTDAAAVRRAVEAVTREWGTIDILVNSAGTIFRHPALDYPEEEWDRVLTTNLKGTFLCCQIVGKGMVERGKGSIVNIASIGGLIAYPGCIAYLASKGGVVQLTKGLAVEWARFGVRVNAIAPFVFDTPMVQPIREREPAHFQRMVEKAPLGRLGQAEEIIGASIFLASPASSLITGHVLAVDGGFLAQ
jgi:NAD(P)-dependent dehydrogenase (short-subunit alcohol dehydrogenase family)